MADPSFASLSPALLARKGGAKPAMRPQHAALATAMPAHAEAGDHLEDLGWNDMGHDTPAPAVPAPPVRLASVTQEPSAPAAPPAVHRQQAQLAERIAAPASRTKKARAAFTLRLDAERHLKLRLATTIRGVSAQTLVTDALDALLADMPELDALAAQVKRR